MTRKRGKFVDKTSTVTEDDQMGLLSVPGAEIVEVEQESWFSIILGWLNSIVGFALLLIVVLALLFTGLGTTILTFTPFNADQPLNREVVLRGAWADTGGKPPIGTTIAVSHTTQAPTAENWWDWAPIAWVGINNASKVRVVSTDYDELVIQGTVGNPTVVNVSAELDKNGERPGGVLTPSQAYNFKGKTDTDPVVDRIRLKNAYLVECVTGVCEPGTFFIVNEANIYGEVR